MCRAGWSAGGGVIMGKSVVGGLVWRGRLWWWEGVWWLLVVCGFSGYLVNGCVREGVT